ncbi:MAG: M20/M25/M40 family metallo-hydrolase [Acidobacteriota bacterium]
MKKLFSRRPIMVLLVLHSLAFSNLLFAQAVPADIDAAIRKEEMEHSMILHTVHYFADLYGPRLTGSPNHVAAANWAVKEMTSWGFSNAALEPWDFGHPGWVNERNTGLMLSPVQDTLTFEVLAWTPSTKGVVTSDAVHMVVPQVASSTTPPVMQNPTQEELSKYLDGERSKVQNKIVLVGKAAVIPVTIESPPKRLNDDAAKKRFDPSNSSPQGFGQGNRPPQIAQRTGALTNAQIAEQLDKFLVDNHAALRINDAAMDHGLIRAFNNRTFDITKVVPTVVLRNEDFGRITRLLADGTPVKLEFDVRNRIVPEGATSYNVVAEIPGTDKKDEVIMLGGHLDSWHSATGATDNAIGCAIMMEAARILKAIGVKPRRTIRVALWSGEEEGLLGSQAYVKRHLGTTENPGPEFGKFNGYFNIDSGTGRARGMSVFGPPETSTVLREALAPYSDLGFEGVISTKSRGLGGTDSTSFNQAGLPGIGIQQDPIEYFTTTWHTNLDTYERVIESDAKSSAIVIAAAVYALAMRDDMLPRFNAGEMPAMPVAAPTPAPTPAPSRRP